MKEKTANDDFERFRTGAAKYAAYLETPEGQLRLDLAFANLQDFLPQATRSLLALDLGCGTGAIAVRLARLGLHVTLLDASVPMLDFAKRPGRDGRGMRVHAVAEVRPRRVAAGSYRGTMRQSSRRKGRRTRTCSVRRATGRDGRGRAQLPRRPRSKRPLTERDPEKKGPPRTVE